MALVWPTKGSWRLTAASVGCVLSSWSQDTEAHEPVGQRFRPVEGEHGAAGRVRIEKVSETGFLTGGLVKERQRPPRRRKIVRQPFGVAGSLQLHASEGQAVLLGLDDTSGGAVEVWDAGVTLDHDTLRVNNASNYGGAVYTGSDNGSLWLTNSSVKQNTRLRH